MSIVFTALSVATATSQGHLAFIYGLVNGFIRILVCDAEVNPFWLHLYVHLL